MNKIFKNIATIIVLIAVGLFSVWMLVKDRVEEAALDSYSTTISWITDDPSTSSVEYGKDTNYGKETREDKRLVTHHKVTISDLAPATEYHYRVKSKGAFGNEAVSKDFVFLAHKGTDQDLPPEISDVEAASIVAAGPKPAPKKKQAQESPAEASKEAGQLVKREPSIEKTLIEKGGLLLPKGTWQIEPAFTYAHISTNRIAIEGMTILPVLIIGEIASETVKRDIFVQTDTLRYGILDDLQAEVKVPFKYQYERITNADDTESTRDEGGVGDIETSIYYQAMQEHGWKPDVILGFTVKSDTGKSPYNRDIGIGTGHWATKFGAVWVKSSDPAIVFGSLGYTWNLEENIGGFGNVDPGDTFDFSLGVAFALNYQLSLNFVIEQAITQKMRIEDSSVPGSFTNASSFKSGLTWTMNKKHSLQLTTSYGLSEDAPDFTLELRFPYSF